MAKPTPVKKKAAVRGTKKALVNPFNIYLDKTNYLIFGLGAVLIVIGFFVMSIDPWNSTPAIVISPIILLVAYVVIFPLGIFYKKKKAATENQEQDVAAGQS